MENTNMVAPPLDLDLNSVKTDLPLLAPGNYELQIAKVERKMTKANAPMLAIELRTTAPAEAQDGSQLGPNVPVFTNINMAPSGAATWDMVLRNVAAVTQALGLNTHWGEFQANAPVLLQGGVVRCKVEIAPAGTDKNGKSFKAKNEIVTWLKRQA